MPYEKEMEFEATLKRLADSLPVPVAFVNRDEVYEFANRSYMDLYCLRLSEVTGYSVRHVLGDEAYLQSRHCIKKALAGVAQTFDLEMAIEGEQRICEVRYVPEQDAQGRVRGFFVVVENSISSLEQTLQPGSIEFAKPLLVSPSERILQRATETANQSREPFVAHMTHEIRTPMTAILGCADILSRSVNEPENLDLLAIIRRNGQYLLEIVDDLLDLAKDEAGRLRVSRRRFRVDQLLNEVVSLMRVPANEKGISLGLEITGVLPREIESDPTRLKQILINLVGNAIKFTSEGGVTIRVLYDEESYAIQFQVIDTGIGIAEDMLERVFCEFEQGSDVPGGTAGGVGLGLAISRRFAEMLGGSLSAVSRIQEGSTFTLIIGGGDSLEPDVLGQAVDELHVGRKPRGSGPASKTILLVDDSVDVCRALGRMLEIANYVVLTATDGEAALTLALECRPDVIVTDLELPGISGFGLVSELRRRPAFSQTRFIALTGFGSEDVLGDGWLTVFDDYLRKPADVDDLIRAIEEG